MHNVIDVKRLNSYRLLLHFDNGEQREIDIRALIPFVGVFEKLNDMSYFNQVRVEPDVLLLLPRECSKRSRISSPSVLPATYCITMT